MRRPKSVSRSAKLRQEKECISRVIANAARKSNDNLTGSRRRATVNNTTECDENIRMVASSSEDDLLDPEDDDDEFEAIPDFNDNSVDVPPSDIVRTSVPLSVTAGKHYCTQEELLYYRAARFIFFGESREKLKEDDKLVNMSSGFDPKAKDQDIYKLIDDEYKQLLLYKIKLCPNCYTEVTTTCFHRECTMFQVGHKRTKLQEYITLRVFSLRRLLRTVLRSNLEEIILKHADIHNGVRKDPTIDSRDSAEYVSRMEDYEDFEKGNINLILALGFDAYQGRRYSKCHFNNIYIKVNSLSPKIANDSENIVLFAQHVCRSTIDHRAYQKLAKTLFDEVNFLSSVGLDIDAYGRTWRCKFVLSHGMADLAGICEAYGLPGWRSLDGCHRCNIKGTKVGSSVSFRSVNSSGLKTPSFFQPLTNRSKLSLSITPAQYLSDRLHTLAEGVTSDIYNDLTSCRPKWPSRKVSNTNRIKIEVSLLSVRNFTDDSCFVLSLKEFRTSTGSEKQKLMLLVIGIVVRESMMECNATLLHMLGYAVFCSTLRFSEHSSSLERLGKALAIIHSHFSPQCFTLKSHITYFHLYHDVRVFGYGCCSTEWIERKHHSIHSRLSCFETSVEQNIKRIVAMHSIYPKFKELAASSKNVHLRNSMNFTSTPKARPDYSTTLGSLCKSGLGIVLDGADKMLHNAHGSNFVVSSRALIGTLAFTSEKYWTRAKTTSSSQICYDVGGSLYFGMVRFFMMDHEKGIIYCVIDRACVSDAFTTFSDSVHQFVNTIPQQLGLLSNSCWTVLNLIHTLPPLLVKYENTNSYCDIVTLNTIICPFIDLKIDKKTFFSPQYHLRAKIIN